MLVILTYDNHRYVSLLRDYNPSFTANQKSVSNGETTPPLGPDN